MKSLVCVSMGAFLFLAMLFSNQPAAEEWQNISEYDSLIIFHGPGLYNSKGLFAKSGRSYQARWVGPSGGFPRAEFFHTSASHSQLFVSEADLANITKKWGWLSTKSLNVSEAFTIWNEYGKTTYIKFEVQGKPCLSFQRYWGKAYLHQRSPGIGTKFVTGYYCRSSEHAFTSDQIEALVKAIGVRGDKTPMPPHGYWPETDTTKTSNAATN